MSRPSKPTELLLLEGKSHRTKAELEYREQGERALQVERELQESAQVKADKVAHAEFLRLKRLYSTIEIVSALDQQAINRYCLELSNVARLQDALSQMSGDLAAADDAEARERLYGQMNRTSAAIHKGVELLQSIGRLFLNQAAGSGASPDAAQETRRHRGHGQAGGG